MLTHEHYPVESEQQTAVELSPEIQEIVDGFTHYLDEEANLEALDKGISPVMMHWESHSKEDQQVRNALMSSIGAHFGYDVPEHMIHSEAMWLESNHGFQVQPWMKKIMGMNDPDKPEWVNGLQRETLLKVVQGKEYWLTEVEIPNRVKDEASSLTRDRVNRIIYFSSRS